MSILTEPLVTAVIPAYNAEATLLETLHSVASQTWRNLEILIVDDGSTDKTRDIAAQFCLEEPRARLICKANGGVASARNIGIAEAQGEWIAPIDADDLWHPRKISAQLAVAAAAPEEPGFVYCWFQVIDRDSRVISSGDPWRVEGHAVRGLVYRNFVGNGSALLVTARAAREVGGYDESLWDRHAEGCEDLAFQLAIARRYAVAAVPEYLVGYRYHPGSMSSDVDRMERSLQLTLDTFNPELNGVPGEVLQWNLGNRFLILAERRANQGDWSGCQFSLIKSLWFDPKRTSLILAYRMVRLLVRLVRGRRQRSPRLHFREVDPSARLGSDPDELSTLATLVRRIDTRRMERLAKP